MRAARGFTYRLFEVGTHYFSCRVHDHCQNGQRLTVTVLPSTAPVPVHPMHVPVPFWTDDAGYCTRAQHPLLVHLATMSMGGTHAQLAPSRDYQSIRKAAQGIGRACEPLLGPLALESSENIGVRASRAMRKVTIWSTRRRFRCARSDNRATLGPPRRPPRSGRAVSTPGCSNSTASCG